MDQLTFLMNNLSLVDDYPQDYVDSLLPKVEKVSFPWRDAVDYVMSKIPSEVKEIRGNTIVFRHLSQDYCFCLKPISFHQNKLFFVKVKENGMDFICPEELELMSLV